MTLTALLIDRIRAAGPLPAEVQPTAARHLCDAVGVGCAAVASDAGAHWRTYAQGLTAAGPASIFGFAGGYAPETAALVNGGLIHSPEYDDTHTGSIVHGSAVLAAAALAMGEAVGAPGAAVLRSYTLWYEAFIRMGLAAAGGFQNRGFQLTSVGGALCAAGIACDLKGLDAATTQAALGIALSQSSGVFEFLTNGATVKSMHPGWAAHAGLVAADLAQAGMTGPLTAIEGKFGLFRVFAGDADAAARFDAMIADLGDVWHLQNAAYKFHPCCHYLHPFIEAARLLQDRGLTVDQIARFECHVPKGAAGIVAEPWDAKVAASGHLARWSLPVTVAMQLVDGKVGLGSFEMPLSPGVAKLAAKSEWCVLQDSRFPTRFDALLRITTTDGTVLEQRVDDVFGNGSRPPQEGDLAQKFNTNLARLAPGVDAGPLRDTLLQMSQQADMARITAALRDVARKESHGQV